MTIHAYIRVSTNKIFKGQHQQTTENQREAIQACYTVDEWWSEDGVSGTVLSIDRPEFKAMMKKAVSGDTIIISKIDRLGRKANDILNAVEVFKQRNIKLRIMQFDGIDITSPVGKMLLAVMSAMAELERDMLSERTASGIARTKAQGTLVGRMNKIPYNELENIIKERKEGIKMEDICNKYGYGRSTINNALSNWKNNMSEYKERWEKQLIQLAK